LLHRLPRRALIELILVMAVVGRRLWLRVAARLAIAQGRYEDPVLLRPHEPGVHDALPG